MECKDFPIGITEDRLKHTVNVAREMYRLAKEEYNLSEMDARKLFVTGFLHDIGYEFAEEKSKHPEVGAEMIRNFCVSPSLVQAIGLHGKHKEDFLALEILNKADLTVSAKGKFVTTEERLSDIQRRHGENSPMYQRPLRLAKQLSLIE